KPRVNHSRAGPKDEPTMSLALLVHEGAVPGAPGAWPKGSEMGEGSMGEMLAPVPDARNNFELVMPPTYASPGGRRAPATGRVSAGRHRFSTRARHRVAGRRAALPSRDRWQGQSMRCISSR